MKSGLKATFKMPNIKAYIQSKVQRVNTAVLNAYRFAGETFVRNARLNGNYNDITGNLRSSIGYVIMQNGKQIENNFEESSNGTDKATGVTKGLTFAETLAAEYPKGTVLICVAGMEYAAAVEAKGRDVITGSSLELQDQLRELIQQL